MSFETKVIGLFKWLFKNRFCQRCFCHSVSYFDSMKLYFKRTRVEKKKIYWNVLLYKIMTYLNALPLEGIIGTIFINDTKISICSFRHWENTRTLNQNSKNLLYFSKYFLISENISIMYFGDNVLINVQFLDRRHIFFQK